MGNVYFEQGKYPSAIKNYRMALDALPTSAAYQRSRLMTNIGLAFVQLGQYADAASTFESALDMAPDHQVGRVSPQNRSVWDGKRPSGRQHLLGHARLFLPPCNQVF
jgi:tetratricopeptide (TPR) repeat protein